MVVNRGVVDKFSSFRGVIPPPLVVKRGDPFAPSSAPVPLGPRTYSKKQINVVRAGHGLRASCRGFGGAFEAG